MKIDNIIEEVKKIIKNDLVSKDLDFLSRHAIVMEQLKAHLKELKIIRKSITKEFMLHQLLGLRLGKGGFSITDLISSAGLTREEWESIKDETDITSLEDSDLDEIEKYVNGL